MTYMSNPARHRDYPKVIRSGPSSMSQTDRLGKYLGWFSLGLGMVQLFAPRTITRTLGMRGQEALVRTYGVREIGSGILTLSTEKKAGLWSRVGGDAIDMVTLLAALRHDNPKKQNVSLALAMVAGVMALDVIAAGGNTVQHRRPAGDRKRYRNRSGFPKGVAAARGLARDAAGSMRGQYDDMRHARMWTQRDEPSLVPETLETESKSAHLRSAGLESGETIPGHSAAAAEEDFQSPTPSFDRAGP